MCWPTVWSMKNKRQQYFTASLTMSMGRLANIPERFPPGSWRKADVRQRFGRHNNGAESGTNYFSAETKPSGKDTFRKIANFNTFEARHVLMRSPYANFSRAKISDQFFARSHARSFPHRIKCGHWLELSHKLGVAKCPERSGNYTL